MSKNYVYGTAQALSAQFNEPDEGKKPSVEVSLKIVTCDDGTRVGEVFTEFMSLSGRAVEYTMKNLRALGWTCNDVTELEGVGSTIAKCGIYSDTYNGVTRDKVSIFQSKAKVQGAAKKSFAAQFKAAAVSAAKVDVTDANKALAADELPQQQQQPNEWGTTNEDEVPF